jgi:hypothetical protein
MKIAAVKQFHSGFGGRIEHEPAGRSKMFRYGPKYCSKFGGVANIIDRVKRAYNRQESATDGHGQNTENRVRVPQGDYENHSF